MFFLMLICAVMSSIMFVIWIILYFKSRKNFMGLIDDLDSKIFTLKDLYFIGLGCIDIYENFKKEKITMKEKANVEIGKLTEAFGREKAELYYYITVAGKISLILTFLPIGLSLTCVLKSPLGLLCGILLAIVFPRGIQSSINAAVEEKKDSIMNEFPKMISKLTLLINAGMLVRKAWDEVCKVKSDDQDSDSDLYKEMRIVSKDIQEGMSIDAAMSSFANRCGLKEIRKFSSIYVQAVNRGASESIHSMKIMADEAWEQKKQLSKQKGEIASQKLLFPNMIMFVGIMLVVVVPMVASMLGGF